MKRLVQWLRACGLVAAGAIALAAPVQAQPAGQQVAICYNCPPEWADWASQIKAIKEKTGITVPFDNKNSGQAIAQMLAEKSHPVADVAYLGITSAYQAKEKAWSPTTSPSIGKTFRPA